MSATQVRPNPDALLARMASGCEHPDLSGARGTLTVFLGYAAGVGKTYAMLEAAHAALADKQSILVGYVEPHARPATSALLAGLTVLAPLRLQHHGIGVNEFDVDAVLKLHPETVLVDELAHTNVEGARNAKRFQDVEELLRAGISVWTTMNVQHLESLQDMVASITGVHVRERVPDRIFDSADVVRLVDIEPAELRHRLEEGKIYHEEQAVRAAQHFFQPENLVALREITLRRMADRVQARASGQQAKDGELRRQVREHILICLSGAPSNARVIRTASRMAEAFHGELTALFVRTEGRLEQGDRAKRTLRDNVRLAEEMGAHIATVEGEDVAQAIAAYARCNGIQKIVTGRSPAPRSLFGAAKNLVERLSELAPDIDLYVIPDAAVTRRRAAGPGLRGRLAACLRGASACSGRAWASTLCILFLCSLLSWSMRVAGLHDASIVGVYFVGVLGVAVLTEGPWYGVAASLASVFLFDFFCTAPYLSLHFTDSGYLATFAMMLIISLIASMLTARSRTQAKQNAEKAVYTELLLGNSRRLLKLEKEQDLLAETGRQLAGLLGRPVRLYPVHSGTVGQGQSFLPPGVFAGGPPPADEPGVVQWVMKNDKEAGAGTDTLPGAQALYIPMSASMVFAVVVLTCDPQGEKVKALEMQEVNLARAIIDECALSVEKERLRDANALILAQVEQERLRSNILRAVSHDLRTPLTSISGNASVLKETGEALDSTKRHMLAGLIEEDALRLIHMVENLLSMTRLEQREVPVRLDPELLEDVINEACGAVKPYAGKHPILVESMEDFLMARMDAGLLVQVLINLLGNAINYTPEGTPVHIRAFAEGASVRVEVADTGPGIPDAEKEHIFDMFSSSRRMRGDGRRGMGLGLALCRSIVQAHGGRLRVGNNTPHGAVFSFTLQRVWCDEQAVEKGLNGKTQE